MATASDPPTGQRCALLLLRPFLGVVCGALAAAPPEALDRAQAHLDEGAYEEALGLADEILDHEPSDDQSRAALLIHAIAAMSLSRPEVAEADARRMLDLVRRGPPADRVYPLRILGEALSWQARTDEATEVFEAYLEASVAAWGPESAEAALALNVVGAHHEEAGRHREAAEVSRRALAVGELVHGADSPELSVDRSNLGILLTELKEFEEAEQVLRRGIALAPPGSPEEALLSNNLAVLLNEIGDRIGARDRYERAVAIHEARGAPADSYVREVVNLAIMRQSLGDDAWARETLERLLRELPEPRTAPDRLERASLLDQIAAIRQGADPEGAIALQREALALTEASLPAIHETVAEKAHALGLRLVHLRRWDEARAPLDRAVAIREQAFGGDPAQVLPSRWLIQYARVRLGEPGALDDLVRDVGGLAAASGPFGNNVAFARGALADELARAGRLEEAEREARAVVAIHQRTIDALASAGSEAERRRLIAHHLEARDRLLELTAGRPRESWSASVAWRSLARRGFAAQLERARRSDDPAVRALLVRRRDLEEDLARRVWSGDGDPDAGPGTEELQNQIEDVERAISGTSRADVGEVGLDRICAAVPADGVLVDVTLSRRERRYLAHVVGSGCAVTRIELGSEEEIGRSVAAWRALLSDPTELTVRVDRAGAEVRRWVWDPLEAAIGEAEQIVIVPDGALHAVPFAALPLERGYLVERAAIHLLDHPAELVEGAGPRGDRPERHRSGGGILLVGGVTTSDRPAPCQPTPFGPLPGTEAEVTAIEALWPRRAGPARVLSGAEATEGAVGAGARGTRVLHLATHGFYGACAVGASDPMTLSGVALAPDAAGDGLWTAAEVATAALDGTELVVLSACDSGRGEVVGGEGVLGLRLAFSLAGARAVVTSLWPVPDAETTTLMTAVYEGLLRRRAAGAAAALRRAQLRTLALNRAEREEAWPQSWAAFVVSGAPGAAR